MSHTWFRNALFVTGAFAGVALLLAATPSASAAAKWSCGEWKKESDSKECRTCTRTVCDSSGDRITNCRTETKTECSVLESTPKAGVGQFEGRVLGPTDASRAATGGQQGAIGDTIKSPAGPGRPTSRDSSHQRASDRPVDDVRVGEELSTRASDPNRRRHDHRRTPADPPDTRRPSPDGLTAP
jgi:hypothetical protein